MELGLFEKIAFFPPDPLPPAQMEEKRHGSRQMKYICEYGLLLKIRGSHFQELVQMHLMDVLEFSVGCRIAPPSTIPRHKETTGPNGGKKVWFTANEIYM